MNPVPNPPDRPPRPDSDAIRRADRSASAWRGLGIAIVAVIATVATVFVGYLILVAIAVSNWSNNK